MSHQIDHDSDAQARTLEAYDRGAERYAEVTSAIPSPLVDDLLSVVARGALILELGSGTGRDAAAIEAAGVRVERTDGSVSFVERLRAAGHPARLLDVRADDFGGPFDAVFANAVLLHVPRSALSGVLAVARRSCRAGGALVASVKKGCGEGWSNAKLDDPRYFVYWDEEQLAAAAVAAGWSDVIAVETSASDASERWMTLTARNTTN